MPTQPSSLAAADDRADNGHRPPALSSYHTTTAPLIVTPTFLTRADTTPRTERLQDEGSTRDRRGEGTDNPDAEPAEIALEANPNLDFEHWDEYWRKVHGPKFAYEEPGTENELVLRYDQVHRVAGGPSSDFQPPYRAMTQENGKLVADPYARVPAYVRPRFDGVAYIAYAAEADIDRVLKQEQYAQNDVEDYLLSDDYRAIAADEATFVDAARSEYWTGLNYSIINRLLPELATKY